MTVRVVFVCAANICRSPTAAKLFESLLPPSLAEVMTVESVGLFAMPGQPWCADARKWVKRHKLAVNDPESHRSRRLSAVDISRADLILAADTDVKSAVLRTDIHVRPRLFTLLEAATLAEGVQEAMADYLAGKVDPQRLLLEMEQLPSVPGESRMTWLVNEMDAARGLVVRTARGARGVDVPDAHSPTAKTSHRATLRLVSDGVTSLGDTVGRVDLAKV